MIKIQNYKGILLPITMDPLKYGKLIYHDQDLYIIQINPSTVAKIEVIIKTFFNGDQYIENYVEIFENKEIILTYKDQQKNDYNFKRQLDNNLFLFDLEGNLQLAIIDDIEITID